MRNSSLIVVLAFASLLVASACGGGFDPTLRVTLEVDTSSLPQDADASEVLDGVTDVIERRIDDIGASGVVSIEGDIGLTVETSGLTAEEAEDLLGRTGQLWFREAEEDEAGDIICRTEEGESFSAVYPPQVLGGVCTTTEFTGEVVWSFATGVLDGQVRALSGLEIRPGSARADLGPGGGQVVIEFTGEGSMLFEQITTRLSSPPRPLGLFLDDELIIAPQVNFAIASSETMITGVGSLDDAEILAVLLNNGVLPAPVRVVATEEIP